MATHPKSPRRRNKGDMKARPAKDDVHLQLRNDVSRQSAEDAVRTLLRWAGEDPAREGLLDTPQRVVDAYTDWFSGLCDRPG